jgi:anti-sigma factor RsiW
MKNFTIATAAAAGFAATFIGLAAPALAAPSAGNAQDTISSLEDQGNRVIVNRHSGTPLSDASVVAIRQGNEIQEYTWDAQRDDRVLETTGRVVYVDVK